MTVVKYWDNVYLDGELKKIWKAIDEVHNQSLWSEDLGSDTSESGESKRQGKGFWLKRSSTSVSEISSVQRANEVVRKIFNGYTGEYAADGFWESGILTTNSHANLLSYYENGDYYDEHFDKCPFTAITWFNREPKKYVGGELYFPQLNSKIESKNNRLVIFPGHLRHQVRTVYIDAENADKGLGRFSITQFLYNDGFI